MKYIESNPEIRGGQLVVKGTRFPISQLLAELEDAAFDLASEHGQDTKLFREALLEVADLFNTRQIIIFK